MVGEGVKKNLYDAASRGDLPTFQELLQGDPYLLDGVSFAGSRNLLHIATIWGRLTIVEEILKIHTQLAKKILDSQTSSPLPIAAAKENVEIATKLLNAVARVYWSRDCHGMNPIHIAAMNGDVKILQKLIETDPKPAREKLGRGDTVLHLCVKHNRLQALEFLANNLGDLINEGNDDGDTVLHLAVRYNHEEIIQYLVKNKKIDKTSRNSKGKTALKISRERPNRDNTTATPTESPNLNLDNTTTPTESQNQNTTTPTESQNTTTPTESQNQNTTPTESQNQNTTTPTESQNQNTTPTESQNQTTTPTESQNQNTTTHNLNLENTTTTSKNLKYENLDFCKLLGLASLNDVIIVVVILIATMAFQAALSPAGGVWVEDSSLHKAGEAVMAAAPSPAGGVWVKDSSLHKAGEAVMASTHPKIYKHYKLANNVAFGSSMAVIISLTTRLPSKFMPFYILTVYATWVSVASIALSYAAAVTVTTPNTQTQSLNHVMVILFPVFAAILVVYSVGNILYEMCTNQKINFRSCCNSCIRCGP